MSSLSFQTSSSREVFQKASRKRLDRPMARDRYRDLVPITYQETRDISISNTRTPFTTSEACRRSWTMSSFSSAVPACKSTWII